MEFIGHFGLNTKGMRSKMIGEFSDYNNRNRIKAYHSSDSGEDTIWLRIQHLADEDREATAELSVEDAMVLITILKKAIKEMKR